MKYKKIENLTQYTEYCDIYESLIYQKDKKNKAEIELIEILLDEYDNRTLVKTKDKNPVELLEYIISEENVSKRQLAQILNISEQSLKSIFDYKKKITQSMVFKLSNYFKLKPQAFNRAYPLKKAQNKNIEVSI